MNGRPVLAVTTSISSSFNYYFNPRGGRRHSFQDKSRDFRMRSLAIYALLASAATLVTAGPVHAIKAAEEPSDLERLDQSIRRLQEDVNNRVEAPGLLPVEGSNTTITRIITPTVGRPGATQLPVPPASQTSSDANLPNPPPVLPVPPVSQTSSRPSLPIPPPKGTTSSVRNIPDRESTSTPNLPVPPPHETTSSVPNIPDRESTTVPTPSAAPVNPPPHPVPAPPSTNTTISKCEGSIQLSFITITSLQPASTITETEKASTVTHTVSGQGVTVTVTAPAAGDANVPPPSHVVPPHNAPSVIEATPNKDGNGVGVTIISIYSPGIPAPTAHPAEPPPPPPAAEIDKSTSSSNQVELPSAAPPPPPPPPESTTVSTPTTASSSSAASSSLAETSLPVLAPTSTATDAAPDIAAPRESAVQGKPSVIAPAPALTGTTTASQPAATVPPPPPIDLSGFTLSSLLDLGNLMIAATAGPDAAVV